MTVATAPHRTLILATTILASSLAFVDGSIVNVALPAIGRSLSAGGGDLSWIINAYTLPLGALLLLGGAAGDRYGKRRLLMSGILVFALASCACATAPSSGWLNAGRALQGVGAAMLMPNSLSILATSFAGEARGRAIGIWAAVGAAVGAVAPLLGGWMVDVVGWRVIFLINLPISAAALGLAWRYLPGEGNAKSDPAASPASDPVSDPLSDPVADPDASGLDGWGGFLISAALICLTWGLTEASGGRGYGPVEISAMLAGGVLTVGFVLVERRRGERAMLPMTLFASRGFVGLSVLTVLLYGALSGMLVLVPWLLIELKGYSATAAGAALLPLPLVIAVVSPAIGRLASGGGARWLLSGGPLLVGVGLLLATQMVHDGSYWVTVFPAVVTIALGMSAAVAPLTTAVLASAPARHTGVASGFNSAAARVGGLIVTALLGAAFASHGPHALASFQAAAVAGAVIALLAGVAGWIGLSKTAGPAASPAAV